jgi:transposase
MKMPKQVYTVEFKELAVKWIKDDQGVSMVCKELGRSDKTLRNWGKVSAEGKLAGAGGRIVTSEEMGLDVCVSSWTIGASDETVQDNSTQFSG